MGGRCPITIGDQITGAVGVADGHYAEDIQVAQAGLGAPNWRFRSVISVASCYGEAAA